MSANRAVAAITTEDDPVQRWWTAVRAVLRTESHDDRGRRASVLLLTVMTAQLPPEMTDIPKAVHELLHYSDLGGCQRGLFGVPAGCHAGGCRTRSQETKGRLSSRPDRQLQSRR